MRALDHHVGRDDLQSARGVDDRGIVADGNLDVLRVPCPCGDRPGKFVDQRVLVDRQRWR
jgi:hypothetical protein